jgi:hypothetical protein
MIRPGVVVVVHYSAAGARHAVGQMQLPDGDVIVQIRLAHRLYLVNAVPAMQTDRGQAGGSCEETLVGPQNPTTLHILANWSLELCPIRVVFSMYDNPTDATRDFCPFKDVNIEDQQV